MLSRDDVHVWCASLDQARSRIRELADVLSPDERARAARFHFTRDRERFVTGRGVLRILLGHYTGLAPGRLRF